MEMSGFKVLTSIDELQMPELQGLYKYWLGVKGDREAPDTVDFDLLDVPDLVSTTGFLSVIRGGEDFQIRFLGQGYTDMTQTDGTGRFLSESPNSEFNARSLEILKLSVQTRKPVINTLNQPSVELVDVEKIESLTLPLLKDGEVDALVFTIISQFPD